MRLYILLLDISYILFLLCFELVLNKMRLTPVEQQLKVVIEKCMTTSCLRYQDLLDKIPAIAEELQVPIRLVRKTLDALCYGKVLGEELANAAKQDSQTSRKREWIDAGSSKVCITL